MNNYTFACSGFTDLAVVVSVCPDELFRLVSFIVVGLILAEYYQISRSLVDD